VYILERALLILGGIAVPDWKKIGANIAKEIKDGANVVAKKATELSAEGQRKLDAHSLKRKIREQMTTLGEEIYKIEKKTPGTIAEESIQKLVKKLNSTHRELRKLEKSK